MWHPKGSAHLSTQLLHQFLRAESVEKTWRLCRNSLPSCGGTLCHSICAKAAGELRGSPHCPEARPARAFASSACRARGRRPAPRHESGAAPVAEYLGGAPPRCKARRSRHERKRWAAVVVRPSKRTSRPSSDGVSRWGLRQRRARPALGQDPAPGSMAQVAWQLL